MFCWLLAGLGFAGATCWAATPEKPNFIFIFCDDLGYNDLGCYTYPSKANPGPPPAPSPTPYTFLPSPNSAYDATRPNQTLTPNIDRLADEGIRFTSFYSAPVCSAARAILMTGCYSGRVGINGALSPYGPTGLNTSEITLAALLKMRGYATVCIGKWHLGSQPQFLPTRRGFDEYFGLPYSNDMSPLYLHEGETPVEEIGADPVKQSQLTQRYTARALDFIERNRSRPFFLYLANSMPHVPVYASTNFAGASGKGNYYDVVMELDWSVGQITAKLHELALETNTLMIFSSDNGPWYSRGNPNPTNRAVGSAYPLRDCKHTTWDGGVRVPFVARWPGQIPAGHVTDKVGATIDILPTFTRLAGGTPPADRVIDGGDLWPVLSDQPGAASPNTNFFFCNKQGQVEAVRSGQWKLREDGISTMLANLDSDIQEATDLSGLSPDIYQQAHQLRTNFDALLAAGKRPAGTYSTQEIVLNTNRLTVTEGSTATFQIKLAQAPASSVTVRVVNFLGDPSVAVEGEQNLSFSTSNWDSYQTVTVAAHPDANSQDGVALLRCSSPSFQPVQDVYVTALDTNVEPGLEVAIQTPAQHTVGLAKASSLLLATGVAFTNDTANPAGVAYAWSATPGEGVTFTAPNAAATGVRFPGNGNYTLQLSASLGGLRASNSVEVCVGLTNAVSTSNLVGWLTFDETNGAMAGDATGNNHFGTLSGPQLWHPNSGRVNGALEFQGANDLVTIADSSDINLLSLSKRTIALWFKAAGNGVPGGNQFLFEEGGKKYGLNLYLRNGALCVGGWNNGDNNWNSTYVAASTTITGGQWHHAALVLDASSVLAPNCLRGYLDGVRFGSGFAATLSSHDDNTGIGSIAQFTRLHDGSTPGTGTNSFTGMIDELLIYNRALSDAEIAALATGPVPAAPVIPQIQIVRQSPSQCQLIWQDGQLQSSTNLLDWFDSDLNSSPLSTNTLQPQLFWRARRP